jgi:hypothetical protein
MIMGDSIAVGIHAQAPRCAMLAHKGWTSARWHQRYRTIRIDADRVVISLGSNDGHGDTASQIAAIARRSMPGVWCGSSRPVIGGRRGLSWPRRPDMAMWCCIFRR